MTSKGGEMIWIKFQVGPMAGLEFASVDIPADVDPVGLLADLAQRQMRWQIDWSGATPEELFLWGRADMVGRVFLAAVQERAVRFMGRRWDFAGLSLASKEAKEMIGEIEDVISGSGRTVTVLDDDSDGDLVIGVSGYEEGFEPSS